MPIDAKSCDEFRIFLDQPSLEPRLSYADYADAISAIVRDSEPRFSVGIFGEWGSGKTTLMDAIKRNLDRAPSENITVWFNAWRYEREEHLIVPLLDALRQTLSEWSSREGQSPSDRESAGRARQAAATIGRVARIVLAATSLSLGVTGARIDFDGERAVRAMGDDSRAADEPVSVYHAAFQAIDEAISRFVSDDSPRADGDTPRALARRIVIFVDDLDRCLPANALEVLESMKLFFDLPGLVFVAGLDQSIIKRAIEHKYAAPLVDPDPRGAGADQPVDGPDPLPGARRSDLQSPITGADYIKKIFQVPFGLPRVDSSQADEVFQALLGQGVPPAQVAHFQTVVAPHLAFFVGRGRLNPRELKRVMNAYTLQLKLLSKKLGAVDPDVVMALQIIAFRPDWERIQETLEDDADALQMTLKEEIEKRGQGETHWLDRYALPPQFIDYLKGPAQTLLTVAGIALYVTSSESSLSSDPAVLHALTCVRESRALVIDAQRAGPPTAESLSHLATGLETKLSDIRSLTSRATGSARVTATIDATATLSRRLAQADPPGVPGGAPGGVPTLAQVLANYDLLDQELRKVRHEHRLAS